MHFVAQGIAGKNNSFAAVRCSSPECLFFRAQAVVSVPSGLCARPGASGLRSRGGAASGIRSRMILICSTVIHYAHHVIRKKEVMALNVRLPSSLERELD